MKKLKPGINTPLKCKKCGHTVGTIRIRQKVKWRMLRWAIGLGLLFEFISNLVVYFIFR